MSSRRTGEVIYGCTQSSPTPNMAALRERFADMTGLDFTQKDLVLVTDGVDGFREKNGGIRKRNLFESAYNMHESLEERERLYGNYCNARSRRERLFVHLLAQSLTLILFHQIDEALQKQPSILAAEDEDLEGTSVMLLLAKLRLIKARRAAKDSDAWLVDDLSERQRELFRRSSKSRSRLTKSPENSLIGKKKIAHFRRKKPATHEKLPASSSILAGFAYL